MDKTVCNDKDRSKYEENSEESFREYFEDRKNVAQQCSDNSDCWWLNADEGGKLDSRQRWSYGSDISIEAVESSQNRLCCSPVDEFDSTISSENEEIIVNNTEETDESFKNYISPASSPVEAAMCRNEHKKRSKNHDVDTADDELIDYSKRYTTESSILMIENKQVGSSRIQQQQRRNIISNPVTRNVPVKKSASVSNRSKVDPFGDYAETDLDQPTNYSLLYVEDSDEEEEEDTQFYCNGVQEDTVKTYYTEGTPYETPSNFSNSTSMSDLLSLEDPREREDTAYRKQYSREQKHEKSDKPPKDFKANEIKRRQINQEDPKDQVLAKINETDNREACEKKVEKLLTPPQSPAEPCDKGKESKTVTFQTEDNFAQETPLMYSRSSSLDSLSEFDQHSIRDDGSVISDFSHRTSTVVSPSELPDSPTQTVPPSPRRLKQQNYCNQQQPTKVIRPSARMPPVGLYQESNKMHHQPVELQNRKQNQTTIKVNRPLDHGSVFEDGLVTFKEESMHIKVHSSTASVLSALTIDDDDVECDNQEIIDKIAALRVRTSAAGMHQAPMQKQCHNGSSFDESDKFVRQPQYNNVSNRQSDPRNNCYLVPPLKEEIHFINIEDDNNGYMLCMSRESKNNKYRDSYKDTRYESHLRSSNQNFSNRPLSRPTNMKRHNDYPSSQKIETDEIIATDTLRIYCTEDTPTYISPFGSQSNLSALSLLSFSDEYLGFYANSQDDEPRSYNEEIRTGSRADAYDTDASSDYSEDDLKSYDDRRIDVSPFDSQLNLDSFALLSIEEEDEEEDEDDYKAQEETNNETDYSTRDDSCAEDDNNGIRRLSFEEYDCTDEDRKVFEDCIKSGVLKVTRQRDD